MKDEEMGKEETLSRILAAEKRCVTLSRLKTLNPGAGRELGRLLAVDAPATDDPGPYWWSIGCECLDRDYADWDAFKALLPMLGARHGRLISGWAKTEQEKGIYDFSWFDPHVREMAAMGVKPWICLAYGNPIWGCNLTLGARVKQVTENPETFAAWLRYVAATVERYRDVVDEWEIWNEPFGQPEYPELFFETAKVIREKQPEARIFAAAIIDRKDTERLLERLKTENAIGLCNRVIYHPYDPNPDVSYDKNATPLRNLARKYSPNIEIMQGENGCPAQLEYDHALNGIEWTEYSQAKWNLRRAIGDAVRGIPSSCFAIIDFQYPWMLQSFGLIRSNASKVVVYRRPSFYAMRNVYSLFDGWTKPIGTRTIQRGGHDILVAEFERGGKKLTFFWRTGKVPSNDLAFEKINLSGELDDAGDLVWIEMITGRVFALDSVVSTPIWDSPILVCAKDAVSFETSNDLPFTVDGLRYAAIPGERHEIDLQWVYPDEFTGDNGTKTAEIRFAVEAPEAGDYVFPHVHDFFGRLFVNGRFIRDTEGPTKWGTLSIPLEKGRNDILFLSRSGSHGWTVGFEIPDGLVKC